MTMTRLYISSLPNMLTDDLHPLKQITLYSQSRQTYKVWNERLMMCELRILPVYPCF